MILDEHTITAPSKIEGVEVQVPQPFEEGHVLLANEAKVLNQVLKENLSNNLRSKVKKFIIEFGDDIEAIALAAQKALTTYIGTYEFGVRAISSTRLTPLERRMKKIATATIRTLVKKSGNAITDENRNELIEKLLVNEEYSVKIKAQAEAELKVEQRAAKDVGVLDLSELTA